MNQAKGQASDPAELQTLLPTKRLDASQQAEWVRSGKVTSEELVNFNPNHY